jgi:AcrR family transcriptional regulator
VAISAPGSGPRRTSLSQSRSRETRARLLESAVSLWTERGFEHGFDDTTVEEIVERAGVTKGTFYFHFSRKDDILLELGWGTAESLYEDAVHAVGSRRSGLAIARQLLMSLARRAESVPRAMVTRAVAEFYASGIPRPVPGRRDMHHGLAVALDAARAQGELPAGTDTDELARVLAALAIDGLLRWSTNGSERLRTMLLREAEIILAGARAAG